MNEVKEQTCGDCRHWRKLEWKPTPGQAVHLDKVPPPTGECRVHPPQLIATGPGQAQAHYPKLISETPRCSLFTEVGTPDKNERREERLACAKELRDCGMVVAADVLAAKL